jgi:shikimate dehydrogenase
MLRCGLLGRKLGHSYSPAIHQALADYSYELFEVEPEQLAEFLKTGEFHGLNVTIPYKTAVIPFCAMLSERALKIGSVNTLIRRSDGSLLGDNTDAIGFSEMVEDSKISVEGKKVLVLGSGGASLTVCHVLRERKAGEIQVISRQGENNYENLSRHKDASVIVNTTPVGMYPDTGASPIDLRQFPCCEGVLDLIYNPARTKLLLDAEELGISNCGGLSMLVHQAKAAAELFTGANIEKSRVRTVLRDLRCQMENIVFIGMPGCGKTTVGRLLAQKLGRKFVDADLVLEEEAGMSIPELFAKEGEAGFRNREVAVLHRLGKESGLVLATGGGCVTREENYSSLHQNGILAFLERDTALLEREGRPLSQGRNLDEMFASRLPLYRRFADIRIKNDAAAEEVAVRIWEAVHEAIGD